ncbi:PREDICTED: uncharacterized protein LOC105567762 [Vollenhovia emeryi]|uniref:uncharacterized protein LOC105567762 n=1 Tax=Vollenhovia emeryi TaxID=411798 RepID=UPI0005F57CC1|nr:PREDICTED: uncharacterized protein LOC105567762 [Vollenhovia emeryi]
MQIAIANYAVSVGMVALLSKERCSYSLSNNDEMFSLSKAARIEEARQSAGFECADVVNIFLPVLVLPTCHLGGSARPNRLTNDAVAEGWLVRGYRDARGDGTFRTATATYNTYRRIAATKIETRERGALSPLASSKDAAPRREHEDSARENTGFPSGYHQRQQHRNDYRE